MALRASANSSTTSQVPLTAIEFAHFRVLTEKAMFSHVMLGVNDLEVSKKFYDAVLGTLGHGPGVANKNRYFYRSPTGTFAITTPINGEPACHGNGSTIGFAVKSPEQGDAFHAAGVANGGVTCENPPGFREGPAGKIYLAYLRDPDGNKICALHRPG
jgi:catechol 2,3-dioxygenase-like lactoylglutathione lyase family enzyme